MKKEIQSLAEAVGELVRAIPADAVERLAAALEAIPADAPPRQRQAIGNRAAQPHVRSAVARLLNAWTEFSRSVPPSALALALRAAGGADDQARREQVLELVWSGPLRAEATNRRTEQVLLDMIENAARSLLLVTYSAYKVPRLVKALREAVRRRVSVTLVLESPERTHAVEAFRLLTGGRGKSHVDGEPPMVYVWPLEMRPGDPKGNPAALHAKCAVADDAVLLVSSANLTESAFEINMELGVLVRGGDMPRRVAEHWRGLASDGQLVPFRAGAKDA